jgi:hypothetical protein
MDLRALLAATAVAGIVTGGVAAGTTAANAGQTAPGESCQVTTPVPGNQDQFTVTAPAGQLISAYCVKSAGAPGGAGAPVLVALQQPAASVVLVHPRGGNITHYALVTTAAPSSTPTDEPTQPTDEPTQPTDEPTQPTDEPTQPTDEPVDEPESTENPPAENPDGSFDWNWTYGTPSCDSVVVAYPSNIPDGQSNDVNIRLETDRGQVTLNYHRNEGTWSGTTSFVYSQHPLWPAGVTSYDVTWVQVGGTNYHWQGDVPCALGEVSPVTGTRNGYGRGDATETGSDTALAVTGYRAGTTTVGKGQRVGNDLVSVTGLAGRSLDLQRLRQGTWTTIATVATTDGSATVVYPKQGKRGTTSYRLAAGTWTSDVLTVTVR